ncbi:MULTISPECIES: aldolase [unclassified Amycolatopsis]|uniref:Cgl0159 family (beta/alpha)8-fold protein n=1 Tax=unclassified Amycolatopsis TaxID=2618356 RepID=UPI0028765D91|nr:MULTISPECIES: aldolase [unclassified Amycolatopsis]MDS0138027.1 aldolase [Amycolatopsis sp. 505]MDS0144060.1 aldolase [Amycolatopsis sp. CM201R]
MILTDERWRELLHVRATNPGAVRQAYATRRRRSRLVSDQGTLFLVAADQAAGEGRRTLLERLLVALANPAVDGVLGTPDIVEELLLLGALHDKVVFGTMNPDGGFTGYDARTLVDCGLDGGELLLPGPARQACADAVTELAAYGLVALIELPEALAPSVTRASALGTTSAYTWLKLPATASPAVLDATTLPVLLGGLPPDRTLSHGVVRGLVMNPAGNVEAAAKALEAAK